MSELNGTILKSKNCDSNKESLIIRYKNNLYNLTKFQRNHPGGLSTLSEYNNKDIGTIMQRFPPHSDAAMYLMQEYKVKTTDGTDNSSSEVNSDGQSVFGVSNESEHDSRNNLADESMEHLVDWSKPMLQQISLLDHEKYIEWVNKPVDRPLRLFESDYLEKCTKTPWWMVPIVWIPIICFLVTHGIDDADEQKIILCQQFLYYGNGVMAWTLLEYVLHRWLFHLKPSNKGLWRIKHHFLIHGLHHKVPFDPYRLVFPPVPAFIICFIGYIIIKCFCFKCTKLIVAGILTGYLIYDMIHFYLHYGSPAGGYLYRMKRYHNQHHFVHHEIGFGISSSVWDTVFNTEIYLRHLKFRLKW